jgi:hypothetical protein
MDTLRLLKKPPMPNLEDFCAAGATVDSIPIRALPANPIDYQSVIEWGHLDKTDVRRTTVFSPFFNKQVEIYTAVDDPEKRVLYRAPALKDKFGGVPVNNIRQWMWRHRNVTDGVFKADSFKHKPVMTLRIFMTLMTLTRLVTRQTLLTRLILLILPI